jgi:hypothetical protein
MSALLKIRRAGFALDLHGGGLSVTPASQLTQSQRDFIKRYKAEIVEALKREQAANDNSADSVATIRAWLDRIGEEDQTVIDEVLARCQDDADCMAYFLRRSAEML